ncbi:aminotransferase class I/II-fold pyridoxal phosphate-dependent enzyme [Dellaglioa sp. P0083]|uniref:aminotransferase class I/II-fold pyridoxal phosphate-dependent enzyme n=1 Tax=Dellaglioa kimchii TaxID=3344667 RepID=UPI0038D4A9C7
MIKINTVADQIQLSGIRRFDEWVSKIDGIDKLTLGEPNFITPQHIMDVTKTALDNGRTHYEASAGNPELRQATADYYNEKFELAYDAKNVLVTVGATEAIATALKTVTTPGDYILVPVPCYPAYLPLMQLQGVKPIFMDTRTTNFRVTAELIEKTLQENKNKAIVGFIFNYPTNPTGVSYGKIELSSIKDVLKKHDIWVMSDEIYCELTYEQPHISMANLYPEGTILIMGLSKSHAMTGWRIGFVLAEERLINAMKKVHQYHVTTAATLSQVAALEAVKNGKQDSVPMRDAYHIRRDRLVTALEKLGYNLIKPDGAFYLFVEIPKKLKLTSVEFCQQLALKEKVAVVPGSAFTEFGEGYFRISFAASDEQLAKLIIALENSKH